MTLELLWIGLELLWIGLELLWIGLGGEGEEKKRTIKGDMMR